MTSRILLISFLIALGACSNPFSSQKNNVLSENPKPFNQACNTLQLDHAEITPKQFRAIIHCFNQNLELDEIESWANANSDQDLQPWTSLFNSLLNSEPEFLHGLKLSYLNLKKTKGFSKILGQILSEVKSESKQKKIISFFQNHGKWFQSEILQRQNSFRLKQIEPLLRLNSFTRFKQEQIKSLNYKGLIHAIKIYSGMKDSTDFKSLFKLFSQADSGLLFEKDSAEKIAGFINWLLSNNHLQTISQAAFDLNHSQIQCFSGGRTITDPLKTILTELSQMNSDRIPEYFQKEVSSILIIGQSFCAIPQSVTDAAMVLEKSALLESTPVFFSYIQPLLSTGELSRILGSESFRIFALEISKFNQTHLIQDLVTLGQWMHFNPLINEDAAEILDTLNRELSEEEIVFLLGLFPEEPSFYESFFNFIEKIPSLRRTGISYDQDWLAALKKTQVASALNLISSLNDQHKIEPLIDRLIELFENRVHDQKTNFDTNPIFAIKTNENGQNHDWLLSFYDEYSRASNVNQECLKIDLKFDFFNPGSFVDFEKYKGELDLLNRCFGKNQSFAGIYDLVNHLSKVQDKQELLIDFGRIQNKTLSFLFTLDSVESLRLFDQLTSLNESDLSQIRIGMKSLSKILSSAKKSILSATETRKTISKYLKDPQTYSAILDQISSWKTIPDQANTNDFKPKLTALVLQKLPALFKELCPSLDSNRFDCRIERDQVSSYQKSPVLAARLIVEEYFSAPQSWIHPVDSRSWTFNADAPETVSVFEYHLNPLLKQFESRPDAVESLFDFVRYTRTNGYDLDSFVFRAAENFDVIPYVYQEAEYPQTRLQYHQEIRIRLLNDLDRLELLAINSDFLPFGHWKNFGMNFIREIALSWGDIPKDSRPTFGTSETLSEAKTSIKRQYDRFNLDMLRKLSACSSNNFAAFSCIAELRDIKARLFNLGSMLSMMDKQENMILFRDLFYSFYQNNKPSQKGVYVNGLKDLGSCTRFETPAIECEIDLLETIPRITRLGLLHQAGVSIAQGKHHVVFAVLDILRQITGSKMEGRVTQYVSDKNGQLLLRHLIRFIANASPAEMHHLSNLIQSMSKSKSTSWMSLIIRIQSEFPEIVQSFDSSLHAVLTSHFNHEITTTMAELATHLISDLDQPRTASEISQLLKSISVQQSSLMKVFGLKLDERFSNRLLDVLSQPNSQSNRDQLAEFINSSTLEDFCDVFSDSETVDLAYKFLEKSNQNNGVKQLLNTCNRFLH